MKLYVPLALTVVSFCSLSQAEEPGINTETATFRVVSYNIKRGLGNDGVTNLERTAGVLKKLEPDFVGLQEVDCKARRSGGIDQAAELGKQLGMHHAFAAFMDYDGGRYGLAILSRHPLRNVIEVKLPKGNEPRVALAVEVTLPDKSSIMLVNLHFDWVNDDRFRYEQAKELKAFLDGVKVPYILLGDFNDTAQSRTLQLLQEGTIEAKKPANDRFTFPSANPTIEIDFIFAAPKSRWTIQSAAVVNEPTASDHRPVIAKLLHSP